MRRTYASSITLPALPAVLALLFAACSTDRSDDDSGSDPPGEDSELAHAQCMRDHGVDYPDPVYVDGEWELRLPEDLDLESATYKEAEAECAREQQDVQPGDGEVDNPADRAQLEEDMDRMLEFAACMRNHGIDFPDPQFDDEGGTSGPAGPADGDWEAFETAREACEDETGQEMP